MDTKKIRVGVICGGKSPEHEISLMSARNVIEAFDTKKFEVREIKIDKDGSWEIPHKGDIDVAFPVLHGPYGEDGTIQGMLEMLDIPYVGAGVLGSAIGMDKEVTKRLLNEAGIRNARFAVLHPGEKFDLDFGWPLFVKPARAGSSVGVSKVKNPIELLAGIELAFRYDSKILIEEYIEGDEIECSVLGNDRPEASVPGRIIPRHEFYSYEAKYLDPNGAELEIPAKISTELTEQVKQIAIKTYRALYLEGMARIDMRIRGGSEIFINEANTIPGFTNISMYPKLWQASGLSYTGLLTRLVELALERYRASHLLATSRD
ncbi:MAG: D-alanine--D-alanine ligase family protein [Patescibacteria group bacterium]